jgi:hypothetical protein
MLMRWQDPKTDWTNGEQFSCEEMNRISANINYLNPKAGLKADYTEDDILTQGQWDALQRALASLIIICGISAEVPGDAMNSATINAVEQLTADMKIRVDSIRAQVKANIYPSTAADMIYPGENYARGV